MAGTPNKQILIVEDSNDLQVLLGQLFEGEGYALLQASNGRQAMEILSRAQVLPAFILLDLMMPEMNGFEFRTLQLKDPRLAAIPVVLMTADAEPHAKALQLNVVHFFKKPIQDLDRLLKLAATFI